MEFLSEVELVRKSVSVKVGMKEAALESLVHFPHNSAGRKVDNHLHQSHIYINFPHIYLRITMENIYSGYNQDNWKCKKG
jgi:hypothetical protein